MLDQPTGTARAWDLKVVHYFGALQVLSLGGAPGLWCIRALSADWSREESGPMLRAHAELL